MVRVTKGYEVEPGTGRAWLIQFSGRIIGQRPEPPAGRSNHEVSCITGSGRCGCHRCRDGALVLPAVASAQSGKHTLRFTSYERATILFPDRTHGAQQDIDRNAAGKPIGYDEEHFTFTSMSLNDAVVSIAGDYSSGLLYGMFNINLKTGVVTDGKVTGGTGVFTGATGTVKVKIIATNAWAFSITYCG
jgi:hypothetical protein